MHREAKITSKGQVTIPHEVRRALDVEAGDKVIFEIDENGVHLRPHRPTSVWAKYEGIFREGEGLTLEEILSQIREMRGHDDR